MYNFLTPFQQNPVQERFRDSSAVHHNRYTEFSPHKYSAKQNKRFLLLFLEKEGYQYSYPENSFLRGYHKHLRFGSSPLLA
jgi:hypothetical protein